MQDLLDHTAARILKIDSFFQKQYRTLILYCKWGCDGSSGQSQYKHILAEESETISDANLFITSLVSIRLVDVQSGMSVFADPFLLSFVRKLQKKSRQLSMILKNKLGLHKHNL